MKNIQPIMLFLLCLGFIPRLSAQVEIKNISEINDKRLDFSPVPYRDGVIFTSSKGNRFLACPENNAGDYTDIKFAKKNADGTFGTPVHLSGDVNGKYNDGSTTFNVMGNKMVFTRNNLNGRNEADSILLKLYSADLVGTSWTNVTELPFNSDDWDTAHPALSADGQTLIFSSNRPGTLGKADLWSSRFENGTWTAPVNLGAAINTPGREYFPFLDDQGNLFFSTDRPGGAGGLDMWVAKQNAAGNWELIGNLGDPFNKGGDDVAFVSTNACTEGYLASDRASDGAKGMDDIYHWKRTPEVEDATIVIVDKETNQRLSDATVDIFATEFTDIMDRICSAGAISNKPVSLKTDASGSVTIKVQKGVKYKIVASKTDYTPETRTPSASELTAQREYIIPLTKAVVRAKLEVLVVEDPSKTPIPLADIKVLDKTTGKVISLVGDGEGMGYMPEIDCDHVYEITASKRPYYDNTVTKRDFKLECNNGVVRVIVPLKAPIIVYLEPIYFDFDRYYIRKRDAAKTLDSLVVIMNRYPSLQVLLGAHCDARGTNKYNEILAMNRANSAKNYLVKKGIDPARLSTDKFGERNPINNCKDDVYCTEPQHQLNRRVDVDPTRHQESGVEFRKKPIDVNIK